jgi:DNA-binding beta-propeller fold protein YncE
MTAATRAARSWLAAALPVCVAISGSAMAALDSVPTYSVVRRVAGPDGGWDYASVDGAAKRFYLARDQGVAVLDLESESWLAPLAPGLHGSGVLVLSDRHRVIASDARHNRLVVIDAANGRTLGTVPTGKGPDSVAFDVKSGIAAVMNSGHATLVDIDRLSAVATLAVGKRLEFAATDGRGNVYVNVPSAGQIAVLGMDARAVLRRIRLHNCVDATGLAVDTSREVLIVACGNDVAEVIRAADGVELARVAIGAGADAVIYDARRQLAFLPCGESGTLVVLDLRDLNHVNAAQTLRTEVGARTGAVDPETGILYLPTGAPGPVIPPSFWPSLVPGTFKVLVVAAANP